MASNALLLLGCGSSGGNGVLTPPTVAPLLSVTADFGASTANAGWTASNKTSSSGFGYRFEYKKDSSAWFFISDTTSLTASFSDGTAAGNTYYFRVTPYNDAGEGPVSNEASVILPGEYDGPTLLGPNGTANPQYVYDDFTLTWSEIAAAVSYRIYGSATDSGYTLWEGDITGTSLAIDFDAAFGTNWWYVVAVDGSGSVSYQSNHLECTPVLPTYSYRRPGGVDSYLRPGGSDTYLRP